MHDGVEPREVLGADVPNVQAPVRHVRPRHQVAALVEEHVEARDVVARGQEDRDQDRADIAVVAGDEDPHLSMAYGIPAIPSSG